MASTFSKIEYVSFDFAKANKRFSENKFPTADPVVSYRSRTGIVCCSDPRCTPEVFFRLRFQEAFCVRNEGGHTADPSVLRTILLIDTSGSTVNEKIEEIMMVHHTGEQESSAMYRTAERMVFDPDVLCRLQRADLRRPNSSGHHCQERF
jgi:carbonic anhydrase